MPPHHPHLWFCRETPRSTLFCDMDDHTVVGFRCPTTERMSTPALAAMRLPIDRVDAAATALTASAVSVTCLPTTGAAVDDRRSECKRKRVDARRRLSGAPLPFGNVCVTMQALLRRNCTSQENMWTAVVVARLVVGSRASTRHLQPRLSQSSLGWRPETSETTVASEEVSWNVASTAAPVTGFMLPSIWTL